MSDTAFQDHYPDDYAHCYGCGRLNPEGHHLKSYWDGEETVCRYTPDPKYTGGFTGFLYGGILASLMDCHGAGTAAAAKAREDGKPISRFVTASLKVDFLAPTPVNTELEVRGKVKEIKGRKVIVDLSVSAAGTTCATGTVVMVQIRDQQ
ncbi:PaaI family thioesterase [Desulfobulbus alkaliphilus]|uniref:PaaI family thioesterase n=1 Tax=Desulfobulbus alkaliphilus TaxID=869814 RepID=UPI0019661205|nr:PaaI family thioesterase [Desulfobulbus alkaliphilus]MBM9535953.1 PaaI family thioesterase [Desulfobulbus alkaliphilus]